MDEYNPLSNSFLKENYVIVQEQLKKQAEQYGAEVWYKPLEDITPKSVLIELEEKEIQELINNHTLSKEKEDLLTNYLKEGYGFIKSSKKSSHSFKKCTTYEDCLEELTHPQIIMSFKKGCKYIFMRQFMENICSEFRVYIYQNKIKYMEEYLKQEKIEQNMEEVKNSIIEFVEKKVIPRLSSTYQDFVVDLFYLKNKNFLVIEVNTPLYLHCGTHLIDYDWEKHSIHASGEKIIFRYKNEKEEIEEI